jgi:uncharacterized protein YggE
MAPVQDGTVQDDIVQDDIVQDDIVQDHTVRTVSVTGHGWARVVPDSAVVRVSAVHRATGLAEALAGADSAARQVVATGREHTSPERIGSTSVQVWPAHDHEGEQSRFEAATRS